MQLNIRSRNIEISPEIHHLIAQRAAFSLDRFKHRLDRITVKVEDVNGPRGGIDKQCTVLVTGKQSLGVIVEDMDEDLRTVIDRALRRAGQATGRRLNRALTRKHAA